MGRLLLFAGASAATLLLGAVVGVVRRVPDGVLAALLALASGALLTAVAVELFEPAFAEGGVVRAGGGLLAGAAVFVAVDALLDRVASGRAASGAALVAAVALDGVPENLALGLEVQGQGLVLLAAIALSNFPEALAGAADMRRAGLDRRRVLLVWGVTALLLAGAVVAGQLLAGAQPSALALPQAFAGGAVLASLATTLMPDAYRDGGPWVGLATAVGFLVSFVLSTL